MFPLRFGTAEQFTLLRDYLQAAGYTEKQVILRAGVRGMHELVGAACDPGKAGDDPLGLLMRLFISSEPLESRALDAAFPAGALGVMKSLGLLRDAPEKPGFASSPMALYPAHGLWFVSDRWVYQDRAAIERFDDIVFPAISQHTYHFMKALPEEPCETFLDLCAGTGVAALVAASRYARRAWSVDITERATSCAEFSRQLNGLENVVVVQGDLYEPLGDLTFDRIVAHPPYVPVLAPGKVYYDGGEDGERVTRKIVEGLARHLAPNGRFICLSMGIEREDEPFERRARAWLGEGGANFDLLYVLHRVEDLVDFAYQSTVHIRGDISHIGEWKNHFRKLKVKDLVQGALTIERHDGRRPPFTIRRQKAKRSGPAEADWLMRVETDYANSEGRERWLGFKPVISAAVELHTLHRVQQGELAPVSHKFQIEYPFSMECKVQMWMAMMLVRCDGKSTVSQIFESCKRDRLIHASAPSGEFLGLMHTFIAGGFAEVEEFPLPQKAVNMP
ncbi:MAG: class I SAM-dependent methyltransferase [Acidobacteriota bacterium]|nr:class I SAM-dependent methyltransferase [Acidobacteriota bacterium]